VIEKLQSERKQWEFELLQKEKIKLEAKIEEAEEYIEKLENKITELNESKGSIGEQWGSIASIALEGLIKRNANSLSKMPGLSGLAEAFADVEEIKSDDSQLNTETKASFKKKNNEVNSANIENDNERESYLIKKLLERKFKNQEVEQILEMLNIFIESNVTINLTYEFVRKLKT